MNRFILCVAWVFSSLAIQAQKVYFIYIQSDAGQPFYVKMEDKLYSSTSSGYLILSRLRDSTYRFHVGFPGNKWPERKFSVTVDKKDQGYLLKNTGEKGWALFNLQTMTLLMPVDETPKPETSPKTDAGDFAHVLSKAADDPSLKEKPVQPKTATPPPTDPPKTDPVAPVPQNEPVVEKKTESAIIPQPDPPKTEPVSTGGKEEVKKTEPVKEPVSTEVREEIKKAEPVVTEKAVAVEEKKTEPAPVAKAPDEPVKQPAGETIPPAAEKTDPYKPSVVARRSESSTTEGFGLTFTDSYPEGHTDTIRILIPHPRPVVPVKEEPREEKKFLEQVSTEPAPVKNEPGTVTPQAAAPRNHCPAVADENDFLRIRKRMAAETSDDNMIAEAKKLFKTRCFTTVQIRNLGALFLNDAGKYNFFDAAYPYVSDTENFPGLEAELKDTYYINRFKAMLR